VRACVRATEVNMPQYSITDIRVIISELVKIRCCGRLKRFKNMKTVCHCLIPVVLSNDCYGKLTLCRLVVNITTLNITTRVTILFMHCNPLLHFLF